MKLFLESQDFLHTILDEAAKNNDSARQLVSELRDDQLNWKPAPEKWSIAQCLEHLAIATSKFAPYFTAALARARKKWPVTNSPAYRPTLIGGWLIKHVVPEARRNLSAPKVFRPSESSDIHGAFESFLKQQGRFVEFVRETVGIDYNKTRLRSPVTPLMRYSLADAFVVTVVHGQRHLAQARRVRETSGFPN